MKKSLRGVFLSGLVFPGLGQWAQGRKALACAFMFLTIAGIGIIFFEVSKRISSIREQVLLEAERGVLDFGRILEMAIESSKVGDSLLENTGLSLIVGCWGASALHAYLAGKKIEDAEEAE
ncbi:MAG: hypothetical protein GY856_54070 [bacterium]|nr:hypothetical protein [bacterium]